MNVKILNDSLYTTYYTYRDRSKNMSYEGRQGDGVRQATDALRNFVRFNNAISFTRANSARINVMNNLTRQEVAVYLANFITKNANNIRPQSQTESKVIDAILRNRSRGMSDYEIQMEIAYAMMGAKESVLGCNSEDILDVAASLYTEAEVLERDQKQEELARRVEGTVNPRYGIKNLTANPVAVNYCVEEILSGRQISIQNDVKKNPNSKYRPAREYNLNDELMAYTDIGNSRNNQEDSVLIMYHPSSPKYKMLVVADGVGGHEFGDQASNETVKAMVNWFNSLPASYLASGREEELKRAWTEQLRKVNKTIRTKYYSGGSTFVGAIVGEKNTLISSIGDSRAYMLGRDGELYQLTDDDNKSFKTWKAIWESKQKPWNKSQKDFDREKAFEKDLLRFRKDSNVITAALGMETDTLSPQYTLVPNSNYRTLMLFSDGVTDCLSDDSIKAITKYTNPHRLAKEIVNTALSEVSELPISGEQAKKIYNSTIRGGKDNTTAAVYNNKDDGRDR